MTQIAGSIFTIIPVALTAISNSISKVGSNLTEFVAKYILKGILKVIRSLEKRGIILIGITRENKFSLNQTRLSILLL